MLIFVCLYLLASGAPGILTPLIDSDPLWSNDILIWDMSENSTWAGPGLTYCTGIFGPMDKQYAAAIIDSTGSQGNTIKIFSSSDGGDNWIKELWITGGYWMITDPELVISNEVPAEYLYIFYTISSATVVEPQGIRFTLPYFIFSSFLRPDWPYSDTLKSVEAVCHPASGELWVFGDDSDHNIYLSRSTDNGDNWTTTELVANDAILPSATAGPEGWVYLTYRRASDNRIMSITFGETSFYRTEIADGGDTSAPVVASEQAGAEVLSVIYHDQNFNIRMALSYDNGAHWNLSSAISRGYYPFIDVARGSRICALAFIDFNTEEIYYASASHLADLATESPVSISDQPVFMGGPPLIRHGSLLSDVSLFYMNPGEGGGPAPQNLWFDNSMQTQSNPEPELTNGVLTVGPNPFTGFLSIEFGFEEPRECFVDVYSMDGRLVESVYSGVTGREILNTGEGLPAGIYSVVLRTGDTIITERVVKL